MDQPLDASDVNLYVSVTDLARPHGKQTDFGIDSQSNKMPGGGVAMALPRNYRRRLLGLPQFLQLVS